MNRAGVRAPSALVVVACMTFGLLAGCASTTFDGLPIEVGYRSANHDSRVRYVVLHFTQLDFARSVEELTRNSGANRVSSHYLVGASPPRIYRLVDETHRAWHAGQSYWRGDSQLNATSIGIEIVNAGDDARSTNFAAYPPAQIDVVVSLVRDIVRRHRIAPFNIVGHSDIAPQRKTDPGPNFPWRRLAEEGVVPWPNEVMVAEARAGFVNAVPSIEWFQKKLEAVGYRVPSSATLDEPTRRVIAAFQMRYRPARFDGVPDAETAALLEVMGRADGWQLRDGDGAWKTFAAD